MILKIHACMHVYSNIAEIIYCMCDLEIWPHVSVKFL